MCAPCLYLAVNVCVLSTVSFPWSAVNGLLDYNGGGTFEFTMGLGPWLGGGGGVKSPKAVGILHEEGNEEREKGATMGRKGKVFTTRCHTKINK